MGARSAVPVEMERGRAVLEVDGTRSPDALIAALVRAAPPNLSVVPLGVDDEGVHLRARFLGGPLRPIPAPDRTPGHLTLRKRIGIDSASLEDLQARSSVARAPP